MFSIVLGVVGLAVMFVLVVGGIVSQVFTGGTHSVGRRS